MMVNDVVGGDSSDNHVDDRLSFRIYVMIPWCSKYQNAQKICGAMGVSGVKG